MNLSTKDLVDKAKAFLNRRRMAYISAFTNPVGEEVLADLAKFCRATETTHDKDALVAAHLDGRREVWLRIQQHLNLTEDQVWKRFSNID
jgi:hypothetical protein